MAQSVNFVTSVTHVALSRVADLSHPLPIHAHTIHTPLQVHLFELLLRTHPDQQFADYLVTSLFQGFRIGYNGPRTQLKAPNLRSAHDHPQVIDEALAKEVSANRIAGPYHHSPFPNVHCSGLGIVPKSDGSWRLINHLSAPVGTSINDYIDPIDYSLHYNTTDDAINILHMLGPNALMAKVDLKNAFRLCPVHPADWPLLGIHWRNMYYINKCLPFGLRSAPFLFNMVADSIQWILHHHFYVTNSFHYLDDFFFAGPRHAATCATSLSDMLHLCDVLGAPLKPEKIVTPTTCLTFLGIQLDTITQKATLPEDKLHNLLLELQATLTLSREQGSCTKRQLLSLIGKLSFATKVIPAGRIFLARLLDLAHSVTSLEDSLIIGP